MSEQQSVSKNREMNPRTARTMAVILSQTANDQALRKLNQADGRNQSEQASYLGAESPFLRDIYERGGTVLGNVVTVPRENLALSPAIEITTTHTAVERLTKITNDAAKARELAPQFVEMGLQIAGSNADGETRLKTFGWLYRSLEGKQELLNPEETVEKTQQNSKSQAEANFTEKWQQIVELSEAMAALEPKDKLPEKSFDELEDFRQTMDATIDRDESSITAGIYENAIQSQSSEQTDEIISGSGLIGFERIEIGNDAPAIPENLSFSDFEKLLEKTIEIDSQLEQGTKRSDILAPFKRYVDATKLDNELRLVEEEFRRTKIIGADKNDGDDYKFVAGREELRELADDRQTLALLKQQETKLLGKIQPGSSREIDREKKEKSVGREIEALAESITAREKGFRLFNELASEQILTQRKKELIEKIVSLELPTASFKEKHAELTIHERNQKLTETNTFEVQSPAEYLFVREAASRQFEVLRGREIKNLRQSFESKNIGKTTDALIARRDTAEFQEKIESLKNLESAFAYRLEGSRRIIRAEPSERAVAGYKFAAEYVRYQLKQPETKLRHQSGVYRDFAARLEATKNVREVIREAYQIREENHRAVGVWKNASKEERHKLERPLNKNEITLLFLEQPPKSYTGEMSVTKYNFAHYSQAKEKMTAALAEGKLEPSAKAQKLIESLEARLIRRDLETSRKATRHFFESLKTENDKLNLKNEFDHRAVYRNLPPHEKDWIYNRASEQKENLEYKIEFKRAKNAVRNEANSPQIAAPTSEAAVTLKQDFAAGTLWHQAESLSHRIETKSFDRVANLEDTTLLAIGVLIHNQTEANNLRVSDWLGHQESKELKTAGEILKTFATAKREIENNRLSVTVKIAEIEQISIDAYKKLFEQYFPADFEKLKEFRVGQNERFRLEQSRRDGQTALLDFWTRDNQTAIYQANAPVTVIAGERRIAQEIEQIKATQIECRRASEVKTAVIVKYEEKLKNEFAKINQKISGEDLQKAVEQAFAPEKLDALTPEQKAIFEKAQNKILLDDLQRFEQNARTIEKGIDSINQSFEIIAALRQENSPYRIAPEPEVNAPSLQAQYESTRQQVESEQITKFVRGKTEAKAIDETRTVAPLTLADNLSGELREEVRVEAHKRARIALEPALLNESNLNPETQNQALEFADALETAHRLSLNESPQVEIQNAFSVAEKKREQLHKILEIEKVRSSLETENKPVTLSIYERELERNEKAITRAKIAQMVETGNLSLADLEIKRAGEVFSVKERDDIKLEAIERTRENLEPKELWAKKQNVSEKLQQAALNASAALEQAQDIYRQKGDAKDIHRAFSALDAQVVRLKDERRAEKINGKFIDFKTGFKRDLAVMFRHTQSVENVDMLAAMTKGLIIDGLEKQNVQPEKIGISREKLNEISRTITLAMADDKNSEKTIIVKSQSIEPVQDNRTAQTKTKTDGQHIANKTAQFEYTR